MILAINSLFLIEQWPDERVDGLCAVTAQA